MTTDATWTQAVSQRLDELGGQARFLSTYRDGLLFLYVAAHAITRAIREAKRLKISSGETLSLYGAFTKCRNELAIFTNERLGRGTIPTGDRFRSVRRSLPAGSARIPAGLPSAIDSIDVTLQSDVLSKLTGAVLFLAGLHLLPLADDIAQAEIINASGYLHYAELLLLLPRSVQTTIESGWSTDEMTSDHPWVRESAAGRETSVIDMRVSVSATRAEVLRGVLRLVRDHDGNAIHRAQTALSNFADFFASVDRRPIPPGDCLRFDGTTNYSSLIHAFLEGAAVYHDADHWAVVDVSLAGRLRRFYLRYPNGCDPFTDAITFEHEGAYRQHPLRFSVDHADKLPVSALARFVDKDQSRLHALAARYADPAWLRAVAEVTATQEYVTVGGVSKAATISLASLALHEVIHLDPAAIVGIDMILHLLIDAFFDD